MQLRGTFLDSDYQVIDIHVLPCNVKEINLAGAEDRIPEECVWDKQETMRYLGTVAMVVYHNEAKFEGMKFGKDRVSNRSRVWKQNIDLNWPHWYPTIIEQNTLQDETAFFALGLQNEAEFLKI